MVKEVWFKTGKEKKEIMPELKLKSVKELFPETAKKLIEKDKEINMGRMFKLSDEEKVKIVEKIINIVDEAKKQREGMIEIKAEGVRNYEGITAINGPWKGSSDISTMVTTIAADTMHARLFPMVWNPETLHFMGVEKHDEEIAQNNEIMMRWAITKDMERSQEKVDEGLLRLILDGTLFIKIQWEIYYPYISRTIPKSVSPKGEIIYEVKYERVRRERAKWNIRDIDYVYVQYNAENDQASEYIVEEVYYTWPMLEEMKAKRLIAPDVDMEEIKASVEKTFDPEGTLKARYEASGLEPYYARMESMPIKCYEACVKHDINDDKLREECVFLILPEQKRYLAGKPLHCVSKIGKRPWIIRPFLIRPGVIYGKSLPELVRHLHKEMDAIHRQRIDAGNMVIAPFFFYRAASGFDPEEIEVKPATGIPLDDPQRDVMFPEYNPGRLSVSFQEEGILMDLIEKLTYLTPAVMGRETASRPTARGTLAVIAQGEQKFSILGARVQRIFCDLITGTRQFYEENLPPGVQKRILGKNNAPVWGQLSPEMIAGQYDAVMSLDLTMGDVAFEKQADQILYQTLVQDPLVNQSPSFMWELRAGYIRALGKRDVEKYIGPKPEMELNPGDVEDENLLFMQEQEVQVKEGDDDLLHMNGHLKFKREGEQYLTINALRKLTMHIMEHRLRYNQKLQQLALMAQGGGDVGENGGQAGVPGALNPSRMGTFQGPRVGRSMGGGAPGAPQPPNADPGQLGGGGT